MRIHLGHHFYGAGNLGDDFMLAGFLAAMGRVAPAATFTGCVPFALEPLKARFPAIDWLPCEEAARARAIAACAVWLGLGGSPFQSAQSRWFIDHLLGDARTCAAQGKRMYYLGIGVQTTTELAEADVRRLCGQATAIWTRDAVSAERLRSVAASSVIAAASDLSHILFAVTPPPPAVPARCALVANFDFATWPGQEACLRAIESLPVREHVWLAQESRPLPGAEIALHAALPPASRARWSLTPVERHGASLPEVLAGWPSGEWLVTSRFHAAIAGMWAGSKVVVIATNEKLRSLAHGFHLPLIAPDAAENTVREALASARPVARATLTTAAAQASTAVGEFVRQASR